MLKSHQKTFLLSVVANAFFLAIPFALLVTWLMPNPTSKYKLDFTYQKIASKPNSHEYFEDLNGDGHDEQVVAFHNMVRKEAAIKIIDNKGVTYDQWNFNGHFQQQPFFYKSADLNNDSYPEIYLLYYRHDTLLMAAFQPFPDKQILFTDQVITRIAEDHGKIDFAISTFEFANFDGDEQKEILFSVVAGFSKQPRGLFIFDPIEKTLLQTDTLGAYIGAAQIMDLNNDGVLEIASGSASMGNIHDSFGIPYNDYHSWGFYFDHELNLKWAPIKNNNFPSAVRIASFKNGEGNNYLAVLKENLPEGTQELIFYSPDGSQFSKVMFENEVDRKNISVMVPCLLNNKPLLCTYLVDGILVFINEKLETTQIDTKEDLFSYIGSFDVNGDAKLEYIFTNEIGEEVIIFDHQFNHPVKVKLHKSPTSNYPFQIGTKHLGHNNYELYIKADEILYFYQYKADPLYFLKYPIWLLIYFVIALVFWMIQHLNAMQSKRKRQVEERFNSLQMRTIKSQLDPHFMFNVLNGLANNVAIGNTTVAHAQILRFSKLLRALISRSDRIDTNLKDELEFVESYLELEKFRFKEDFEYSIKISEEIAMTTRIPKMLVQLLVENGIKHGLRNKMGVKRIHVEVNSLPAKTQILITDNGIGRKAALKYKTESGNGLSILQDMISLNKKLGGKEILVNYIDLFDENNESAGTRVELVF